MSVQRGDVVLIDYPYATAGGSKVRPALVIQNDKDNQRLVNTIVAQITGTVQRATTEATQLLIDVSTAEGQQSGLRYTSVVNCRNLFTINQQDVLRKLGSLPPPLLQ
jgi:mRNA interferase MazF